MAEIQRRTEVLEAEQAVRLLAKSLAGANASKIEFDTVTAILAAAAHSVTAAASDIGRLRHLISNEHEQISAAIVSTVTQAQRALEAATVRLSQLGEQVTAIAVDQAASATQRMRELEMSVDRATGRLDTRVDKIGQMVSVLQKQVVDEFSKSAILVHSNATDSTIRLLESIRCAELSLRDQTAAASTESAHRITIGTERIENVMRNRAAESTSELQKAMDTGVRTLVDRLAEVQQAARCDAETHFSRSRTVLLSICLVEGAAVLGILLLLWRHW